MPSVCVLTCPPEVRAVSNTKAYQSPLDVPPPPRNLTTRIKAKLRNTPYSVVSHPPDSSPCVGAWPSRALMSGPRARAITRSLSNRVRTVQAHLLFPPPAPRYCPALPHALPAFVEDRASRHVHSDRLPTDIDVFHNGAQSTLLQNVP